MIASPISAPAVTATLLEYLQYRLGVGDLSYAEEPVPITDGWQTYIYQFRLKSEEALPAEFQGPLILRVYSSIHGLPRLENEVAVQNYLRDLAYPVAEPLLVEETDHLFGGPFMIMEMLPGRNLLREMLHRFWRIAHAPIEMAEMQARLHRLPICETASRRDGETASSESPVRRFPVSPFRTTGPAEEFLGRQLTAMQEMIDEYDLHGFQPGLDWLRQHRPEPPASPSIIHLDFHPVNMMCQWRRCTGILDWSDADIGDRHADVAATLTLIQAAPSQIGHNWWQRFITLPGRWLFQKSYLYAYRRRLPLEDAKLAYYLAFASLRRLCHRERWMRGSPEITGCKPCFIRYLRMERAEVLLNCFQDNTGIAVPVEGCGLPSAPEVHHENSQRSPLTNHVLLPDSDRQPRPDQPSSRNGKGRGAAARKGADRRRQLVLPRRPRAAGSAADRAFPGPDDGPDRRQ
jgi:aminoglycoside phosphotransferase (APT) family kinase protein